MTTKGMMTQGAEASGTQGQNGKMGVDLTDSIEKSGCYARNEDPRFPMTNLFIGDTRLGCKSDADEQLIIHIAFNTFVKVCLWGYLSIYLSIYYTDF
jgi:hypothetical protein